MTLVLVSQIFTVAIDSQKVREMPVWRLLTLNDVMISITVRSDLIDSECAVGFSKDWCQYFLQMLNGPISVLFSLKSNI